VIQSRRISWFAMLRRYTNTKSHSYSYAKSV
jgi:hypothetical protein